MKKLAVITLGILVCAGLITLGKGSSALGSGMATEVIVKPGDTLWSIAVTHNHAGRDVRELVDALGKFNRLDGQHLQIGQKVRVPAEW